jgi:hypothetical protein
MLRICQCEKVVTKLSRTARRTPPSQSITKGIPFRPQDLVLHDCLSHSIRQGTDDLRFHTDEGGVSMTSLSKLLADDARFLREAALEGLGVAMLPERLVADDLASGRLMRVLEDFKTIDLAVHALHPHGRLAPASVRAFLDHLAAVFRDPSWNEALSTPRAARRTKGGTIPMTEQDVRRLGAVAALYADVDGPGAARLHDAIARARVLPPAKIPRTSVTMNSRVRLGEREVSLAYPWESAPDRVSVLTALGRSLLGASVGDRVGKETITDVLYQSEAAGDHHL